MKYALIILASSLLMTGCSRQDAKFSRQIVGTWKSEGDTQVFNSDGSFLFRTLSSGHTNDYAGTWQIRSGIMTVTPTNATGPDPEVQVGDIVHFKIIRIDAHLLSYTVSGQTILCNRQ
jgi:hypothetical protein